MKYVSFVLLAVASAALSSACQPVEASGKPGESHKEILARLDSIDARLANLEKRGPAAGNRGRPAVDPNAVHAIPVTPSDTRRGAEHAKVTIVEASEFACPFCARLAPVMSEVVDAYPNDVRLVFKQFVVHPQTATRPALASCAAQKQGKFGDFEKALWDAAWGEPVGRLDKSQLGDDALVAIAKGAGLDGDKLRADMDSAECKQLLTRNRQEVAKAGGRGTPTVWINGKLYTGQRTLEGFKKVVDAEIEKANKAISGGVELKDYYAHVTKQKK